MLFRQATDSGWFIRSESNVLNFLSAAIRAQRSAGDPVREFKRIVQFADWKQIHQEDEDKARSQLNNYRERVISAFSMREEPTRENAGPAKDRDLVTR